MNLTKHEKLGTEPIGSLLIEQSIPASMGILVLSIYMIVDTIFVGQWIGADAISAITVVLPITFLISAIGMAIGVGGGSIISRALGAEDETLARKVFGNQITMIGVLVILACALGFLLEEQVLHLFGARGNVMVQSRIYYRILLAGVPFLAFAMMANSVVRAIGHPKVAMYTMMVPAIVNLILDPVLIKVFDWGMAGAAWATTAGYVFSGMYIFWFFKSGKSPLTIDKSDLRLSGPVVKEINSLGAVTLARQGTISLVSLVLNNTLVTVGGEIYLAVYGIISRMLMFIMFPVFGVTQGMLPIVGFNYGAEKYARVKQTIRISLTFGIAVGAFIYMLLFLFSEEVVNVFTQDERLLELTPWPLLIVFMASPLIAIQTVGSGYYQALGKALPALMLTLMRQGFFLVPLLLILPKIYGISGVWWSFPISGVIASTWTYIVVKRGLRKLKP